MLQILAPIAILVIGTIGLFALVRWLKRTRPILLKRLMWGLIALNVLWAILDIALASAPFFYFASPRGGMGYISDFQLALLRLGVRPETSKALDFTTASPLLIFIWVAIVWFGAAWSANSQSATSADAQP
jgi:hypothetical protein